MDFLLWIGYGAMFCFGAVLMFLCLSFTVLSALADSFADSLMEKFNVELMDDGNQIVRRDKCQ
jgi:hypothetical protein